MNKKTYFSVGDLAVILISALVSAIINLQIPMKDVLNDLGIQGPAGGMALFGGLIFLLWISLAHLATGGKRFSGIATAILIVAFCLLASPWYGVVDPPWFGVYGVIAFLVTGSIIEASYKVKQSNTSLAIGGGLGNLTCLLITWIAIGSHTGVWLPQNMIPAYLVSAFLSGVVGSVIASIIVAELK